MLVPDGGKSCPALPLPTVPSRVIEEKWETLASGYCHHLTFTRAHTPYLLIHTLCNSKNNNYPSPTYSIQLDCLLYLLHPCTHKVDSHAGGEAGPKS